MNAAALLGLRERRVASAARGWEHRREGDENVEVNLRPDELALWRRIKGRFRGTPHRRFEQFRQYVHDHPAEMNKSIRGFGEERAKKLVRERESAPYAKVPCAPPFRFRNRAACKAGGLGGVFGGADVPCREPYRFRVKELCAPRRESRQAAKPEPQEHAFAGLL